MTTKGTVAVTGASGFFGAHLLPALLDAGYNAIAVGRRPPKVSIPYRPSNYDQASLAPALAGADFVVHLAARTAMREDSPLDLRPYLEPNVIALRALCEGAQVAGVRRIVFASSRAVYPTSSPKPLVEGRDERPRNAYGLSKLYAEEYLDALAAVVGLSAVYLRFSMLFGEGERETPALMRFARLAGRGEALVLSGNAAQRIDVLYVKDAVEAVLAALRAGARGPINVGSGQAVSVRGLASAVNAAFDNQGNLLDDEAIDGPALDATLDIALARRLLGWSPSFTLSNGLEDFRRQRENEARKRSG